MHSFRPSVAMKKFQYLLEPRSIAVVGVSDDTARPGSQAVHALLNNGYRGSIFPVNPKYEHFGGMPCYPSVDAIPQTVDLVVIGVPAGGVVAVMQACARKKVNYVVVLSGGFRESGSEGIALEIELMRVAREAGIRILGPNCLGFANIHSNVYAAFGSITRAPKLATGSVSLVTQSGGFGYSIALACAEAGIGFRHVITTGNETDIDHVALIDALVDDEATRCILVYIEGTRDGRALLQAARRALAAGKPLLLWKGGVTKEGKRAAESHTASLTGVYDFYRAMFKQTGIVEIQELHEAVDYLLAFGAGKYPSGSGAAVMGVSGGSAIVFADACEPCGLHLCELTPSTQEALAQVVPHIGAIHNPVDLTAGYFSVKNQDKLDHALRATLADPGAHSVCVNLATTGQAGSLAAAQVMGRITGQTDKPLVVFSSAPASQVGEALQEFAKAGVPVFRSPSRAARALAVLRDYRLARARLARPGAALPSDSDATPPAVLSLDATLSETRSKALLSEAGITVTRDVIVNRPGELSITDMKPPLVVKIVSADIAHKTEIGGVKLGISTQLELDEAIALVLANARTHVPAARIDGVLVSEMVRGGFELIAGVVNDEVFGPVVVVGAGGIYAEILKDTSFRLAPFDEVTAHEMLAELQCRPILDGARGLAPRDTPAIARTLAALSQFAWTYRDQVQEVDINPLFALPEGVVAADALVVPRRPEKPETA